MRIVIRLAKFVGIGILSIIIPNKAKSLRATDIDRRIENVRNTIQKELQDNNAEKLSVPFRNYGSQMDWVNWGNWGNWSNWNDWNNWNNWLKWNDWNNWAKWNDWNNWGNY